MEKRRLHAIALCAAALLLAPLLGCARAPAPPAIVLWPAVGAPPQAEGPTVKVMAFRRDLLELHLEAPEDGIAFATDARAGEDEELWLVVRGRFVASYGSRMQVRLSEHGEAAREAPEVPLGIMRKRGTIGASCRLPASAASRLSLSFSPKPTIVHLREVFIEVRPVPALGGVGRYLSALARKGSNVWFLLFTTAVLAVTLVLWIGRRGPGLFAARRFLIGAAFVLWTAQGAWGLWLHLREARFTVLPGLRLTQGERRTDAMRVANHDFALLIDRTVPPSEDVGVAPAQLSMGTYRLLNAILPRMVVKLSCAGRPSRDAPSLPPYVAAQPGCFREDLALHLPSSARAIVDRPWVAELGPIEEPRRLTSLSLPYVGASKDEGEDAAIELIDGAGKAIWQQPLPTVHGDTRFSSLLPLPLIEVPRGGRMAVRLRVTAAGRGDGQLEVDAGEVRLGALPRGYVPVESDGYGHLVARRADIAPKVVAPVMPREEAAARGRELPRLLFGLLATLILGDGCLRLLAAKSAIAGGERLALCYVVGIGSLALLAHAAAVLAVPRWWPASLLAGTVLAAAGLLRSRPTFRLSVPPGERAVLVTVALLLMPSLLMSLSRPISGSDELHNWGLPAHLFFHVGPTKDAIRSYATFSPIHQAYPPGTSLCETLACLFSGRWDDARCTLPFPLFYGAMMLLVGVSVNREAGTAAAVLATFLAGTASMALAMAPQGMADLPLGCVFLAAMLCLERHVRDGGSGPLLLAGYLCSQMAFMKREGGPLRMLVLAIAIVVLLARTRGRGRILTTVAMASLAFVPVIPWQRVYHSLAYTDWIVNRWTISPTHVVGKLQVLPRVLQGLAAYLFADSFGGLALYNATYVLLLLLLLLAPRSLVAGTRALHAVALAMGMAGYCFIYVLSPAGLVHMANSFGRILLHLYPIAVLLAVRAAAGAFTAIPSGKRTTSSSPMVE